MGGVMGGSGSSDENPNQFQRQFEHIGLPISGTAQQLGVHGYDQSSPFGHYSGGHFDRQSASQRQVATTFGDYSTSHMNSPLAIVSQPNADLEMSRPSSGFNGSTARFTAPTPLPPGIPGFTAPANHHVTPEKRRLSIPSLGPNVTPSIFSEPPQTWPGADIIRQNLIAAQIVQRAAMSRMKEIEQRRKGEKSVEVPGSAGTADRTLHTTVSINRPTALPSVTTFPLGTQLEAQRGAAQTPTQTVGSSVFSSVSSGPINPIETANATRALLTQPGVVFASFGATDGVEPSPTHSLIQLGRQQPSTGGIGVHVQKEVEMANLDAHVLYYLIHHGMMMSAQHLAEAMRTDIRFQTTVVAFPSMSSPEQPCGVLASKWSQYFGIRHQHDQCSAVRDIKASQSASSAGSFESTPQTMSQNHKSQTVPDNRHHQEAQHMFPGHNHFEEEVGQGAEPSAPGLPDEERIHRGERRTTSGLRTMGTPQLVGDDASVKRKLRKQIPTPMNPPAPKRRKRSITATPPGISEVTGSLANSTSNMFGGNQSVEGANLSTPNDWMAVSSPPGSVPLESHDGLRSSASFLQRMIGMGSDQEGLTFAGDSMWDGELPVIETRAKAIQSVALLDLFIMDTIDALLSSPEAPNIDLCSSLATALSAVEKYEEDIENLERRLGETILRLASKSRQEESLRQVLSIKEKEMAALKEMEHHWKSQHSVLSALIRDTTLLTAQLNEANTCIIRQREALRGAKQALIEKEKRVALLEGQRGLVEASTHSGNEVPKKLHDTVGELRSIMDERGYRLRRHSSLDREQGVETKVCTGCKNELEQEEQLHRFGSAAASG
ncbi:hypothetical protein HDU93_003387 [Gonapodya sp. JEL0774]|nr:hypothetical protein HDU93_003387 [Gonapodya sp. JEL0774]